MFLMNPNCALFCYLLQLLNRVAMSANNGVPFELLIAAITALGNLKIDPLCIVFCLNLR